MARTRAVEATNSLALNTLLTGNAWVGRVTWAFQTEPPRDGAYAHNAVSPPSPALREAVRSVVAQIEKVTAIDLVELGPRNANTADLRIFEADVLAFATPSGTRTIDLVGYGFYPGTTPEAGDIWIGSDLAASMEPGSFSFRVLLHEFGHALGLKEPHAPGPFGTLPAQSDSPEFSVMSTRSHPGAPAGGLGTVPGGHARTFMQSDIAALQHLYGPGTTVRNDRYRFDPFERSMQQTVWDGGGVDMYDFSAFSTRLPSTSGPAPGR
jgi:serralysin